MPRRTPASPWFALVLPAVALISLMYVVPLARVLWLSVSEPSLGFGNYRLLISNATIQRIAGTTLWICGVTTLLTVAIGYVIAYAMVHAGRREMRLMLFCILLAFWLSVLVRSFALLLLLRNDGLVNQILLASGLVERPVAFVRNTTGVIIGMVHVMIPLAVLSLYASLRGIEPAWMDAARGLGCGPRRTFAYVFLPLSRPGLASALVLVFIFSLGFFVTPAILGGGKVVMITEYIRVQFEQNLRWGLATMLATTLLATVLVMLALASRFLGMRRVIGGAH